MGNSTVVVEVGSKEADQIVSQLAAEMDSGIGAKVKARNRKADGSEGQAEPATKPLPPVPAVDEKAAQLAAERKADLDKLELARTDAAHAVGSFETGTAISIYGAIGEKCWNAVYLKYMMHGKSCNQRGVPNSWTEKDYDNEVSVLRTRCEVHYPHLFLSDTDGKKNGVVAKVSNYILAHLALKLLLDSFGAIADAINGLSYHCLVNLIARKCVTFSKVDMAMTLKPSWAEFLRVNIPRLHIGTSDGAGGISYKDFVAMADKHENDLSSAKSVESVAGKTPAQLAQEAKEAEIKKKAKDESDKENKIRTDLSTSLSVALAGGLKPDAIAAIIDKSAKDAKVSLEALKLKPQAGPVLNPATVPVKEVASIIQAMGMAGRFDDIRQLHNLLAKMVSMLDMGSDTDKKSNAA